jgi:hypothetical protein
VNDQYIAIIVDDSSNTYVSIGTLSGTTMTWGTPSSGLFTALNYYYDNTSVWFDAATSTIVVSNGPRVIAGSVSAGSITWGTMTVLSSVFERSAGQVSLDGNGNGVLVYSTSVSTSYNLYAHPFTVSGTSVTAGTATSLTYGGSGYQRGGGMYSSRLGGFVVSYNNSSNADTTMRLYTTNGSTMVYTGREVSNTDNLGGYRVSEELVNEEAFIAHYSSSLGLAATFEADQTDADSWVGISTEAISDTSTGAVTIIGGVNDQQTGLTANAVYYVGSDGSLATSGTRKIGKALSATELLVTEGNA